MGKEPREERQVIHDGESSRIARMIAKGKKLNCAICGKKLHGSNAKCSNCFPLDDDFLPPDEVT